MFPRVFTVPAQAARVDKEAATEEQKKLEKKAAAEREKVEEARIAAKLAKEAERETKVNFEPSARIKVRLMRRIAMTRTIAAEICGLVFVCRPRWLGWSRSWWRRRARARTRCVCDCVCVC